MPACVAVMSSSSARSPPASAVFTSPLNAVAVTPDGRRALSASDDRTLRLWDLERENEIAAFTGKSDMGCCAVAPAGRRLSPEINQAECILCGSSKRTKQSERPPKSKSRFYKARTSTNVTDS